jgi:IS5 family transposase
LLLKLEFLQYHDRLSDRQVIEQAKVNVAYREFLELGLKSDLPDPSLLSRFRARLGAEGHRRIFDDLVAQARERGLVKDRLRLKDATHVIANVAIPTTIRLVATMRDRLLDAATAYDPERAEGERLRAETKYFTPGDFSLDEAGQTLTCPAGKSTTSRNRNYRNTGWEYRFRRSDCAACPLLAQCMSRLPKQQGRAVNKGEYVAEYAAAQAKAQTEEYAEVRKTHRKVERKLGEIVRHHGGRRARCRGQPKVLMQELMAALVVNVRRFVQRFCAEATLIAIG